MNTGTNGYKKTHKRVLNKRAVLWLGQTCNLRCQFCYFLERIESASHKEHPFMTLEKAKAICSCLVDFYHNNAIDIQGGEPTLYREILELTQHCRNIGLLPTLITNAVLLCKRTRCSELKAAGVRDLLISVHGLGDNYDSLVGVKGASKKQMAALENIVAENIPFRFNCVLSKTTLPELMAISELAHNTGARVVNFITFNPFEDQHNSDKLSDGNVANYTDVKAYLTPAMDYLEDVGIECNVRYLPMCMAEERHRKNIYNFQQNPYDLHEWDYVSWSWTALKPQRMRDGEITKPVDRRTISLETMQFPVALKFATDAVQKLIRTYPHTRAPIEALYREISFAVNTVKQKLGRGNREEDFYRDNALVRTSQCDYCYSAKCKMCSVQGICDGFHGDYASIFGADEAAAIELGIKIYDPTYYISGQEKVVEEEDYDWAF
ncbi:MAG: radical SAM protein [Nitrospirae bacterium]|nr:radical SAM protein [Nitrospirota bacterium]MBF0536260.1 radical SAM protein [Nitrospirota bacterium]MBF0615806.1 radical SAM protein [Nitrospirota bacterium]